MKYYAVACCVALSSVASIGMPIGANAAPIGCSAVAGTVSGKPGVKSVTSALQPANGSNVAYCKVSILYGNSANENINIMLLFRSILLMGALAEYRVHGMAGRKDSAAAVAREL